MTPTDLETLIQSHLDGRAHAADVEQLSRRLEEDGEARKIYLRLAHLHASLAGLAAAGALAENAAPLPASTRRASPAGRLAVPLAGLVLAGLLLVMWRGGPPPRSPKSLPLAATIAQLTELKNCRWVSPQTEFSAGDRLAAGQRLELAAGEARIEFDHGAVVVLSAPAIFDLVSSHETFLLLGQLQAEANTEAAHGFCVRTRTARFVDFGTAFSASAAADGHSRVDVTSGMVEVQLGGTAARHMLRAGESMGIEPGQSVVTTRIESGDGTAAFRFPSIEPPSNRDHADGAQGRATINCLRGQLNERSGSLEVLTDGKGQSQADAPDQSAFFSSDQQGLVLLDLGSPLPISRINTYSWHQDRGSDTNRIRATQKFYLYGSAAAEPPGTGGPLNEQGWVLLGRVNTDEFFEVSLPRTRPEQQATSITAARGPIGSYRHLLWDVRPSRSGTQPVEDGTFYGEFDVYVE